MAQMKFVVAVMFFIMAGSFTAQAKSEKLEAVQELIEVTNLAELAEKTAIDALRAGLAARYNQHPNIPENVRQKTFEILKETFQENMDSLLAPMARIYDKHFSLEELQDLISFYKSDLGQKIIKRMPIVMRESMIVGALWGERVGAIAMERIQTELASKGYEI